MTTGKRDLLILWGTLLAIFAALALLMSDEEFYLARYDRWQAAGISAELLWMIRSIYIIPLAVWSGVWLLMGLFSAFYSCIKPARGFVIFCAAASAVMLLLYVYFSIGFVQQRTMPPMPLAVSWYIQNNTWMISAWLALAAVFGHVAITHRHTLKRPIAE